MEGETDFYPVYGTFKQPVEAILVFLLLDRLASFTASITNGESMGLLSAIALWITIFFVGYALLTVITEPEARSIDVSEQDQSTNQDGNSPLYALAIIGGVILIGFAWGPFFTHVEAWVGRVMTGPGAGLPAESSLTSLLVWVVIMFAGIKVLSWGADRFLTHYWRKQLS